MTIRYNDMFKIYSYEKISIHTIDHTCFTDVIAGI